MVQDLNPNKTADYKSHATHHSVKMMLGCDMALGCDMMLGCDTISQISTGSDSVSIVCDHVLPVKRKERGWR